MAKRDRTGDGDDHRRVDHRTNDLAPELLRLLEELGQPLQDNVEHTAGLAGCHHVAVQAVEHLRVPGHGLGESCTALDVLADLLQHVLEHAGLLLLLEDLDASQDGQARVLERRELTGELRDDLRTDPAEPGTSGLAFLAAGLPPGSQLLLAGLLDHLCREIAEAADLGDRFLLGRGLDLVLDLLPRGVECLIREDGHRNASHRIYKAVSGLPPAGTNRPGARGNHPFVGIIRRPRWHDNESSKHPDVLLSAPSVEKPGASGSPNGRIGPIILVRLLTQRFPHDLVDG